VYEPVLDVHPLAMTLEDIEQTIRDFIQAARRAKEADFDGVQVHVSHVINASIPEASNAETSTQSVKNRINVYTRV
jgi:2,4-dienoyl-CoA reductase-like NADH-dependent reductase (Old Yellow Enzyme family)